MPVTLDSFRNAVQPGTDNRAFQVKNDKVDIAGRWKTPNAEANRQAMTTFIKALKTEFGDHIANMISKSGLLKDHQAEGKPLTGYMVRDLIKLASEEKNRVKDYNSTVIRQFINGQDKSGHPQPKNLDAAVAEFCQGSKIPPQDWPAFKDRVEPFLTAQAEKGAFNPAILNLDTIFFAVKTGRPNYTANVAQTLAVALSHESAACPASQADKLRLADLGIRDDGASTFLRTAWQIRLMRELQPQGDLTPATVWKAVFDENLPAEVASGQKPLGAALAERCQADAKALVARSAAPNPGIINVALTYMPWDKACVVMKNYGQTSITLQNMPGLGTALTNSRSLKEAEDLLAIDNCRAGIARPEGLPPEAKWDPPVFTFNLPGGKTEQIQVGGRTNFEFANEADKQAYLGMQKNSLSDSLINHSRAICGPDATEKQLAGVLSCLNQDALLPLKHASQLAGTEAGLNEHGQVSVSLSREDGGAIRAEFSSPLEGGDIIGRFRMTLTISTDGEVKLREFELTPPRLFYSEETKARADRVSEAQNKAAPFLALDNSPNGLLATVRQGAQTLGLKADITPKSLKSLGTEIAYLVNDQAAQGSGNLTADQVKAARDLKVKEFFDNLDLLAKAVPEEKRDAFVRACLETGVLPKPEFVPAIMTMTGQVRETFDNLLIADSGQKAVNLMTGLQSQMTKATIDNKELQGKGFSGDDFTPPLILAMRLGLQELVGQQDPEILGLSLARQGSAYRDMLHALANDPNSGPKAMNAALWFNGAMEDIFSSKTLARLDPYSIHERDLSLARQREIVGPENITRGLTTAVPGLKVANETLPKDMKRIKEEYLLTHYQEALTKGPGQGHRDPNNLSEQFALDYLRSMIYLDGKHHKSEKGDAALKGFKELFPEPYVAEKLSNLANQAQISPFVHALNGIYQSQMNNTAYTDNVPFNTDMLPGNQTIRIDTLDRDKGLYRITSYASKVSGNPRSNAERIMYEVSVDIDLGRPGAVPRPDPTVGNIQMDFMVRGREETPERTQAISQPVQQAPIQQQVQQAPPQAPIQPAPLQQQPVQQPPVQQSPVQQTPLQQPIQPTTIQPTAQEPPGPEPALKLAWQNITNLHKGGVCEAAVTMWIGNLMDGKGTYSSVPARATQCDSLQTRLMDTRTSDNWVSELTKRMNQINKEYEIYTHLPGARKAKFDGASEKYNPIFLKGSDGPKGLGWLGENLVDFAFLSAFSPEKALQPGYTGHAIGIQRLGEDDFAVFDPNFGLYSVHKDRLGHFLGDHTKNWSHVTATTGQAFRWFDSFDSE